MNQPRLAEPSDSPPLTTEQFLLALSSLQVQFVWNRQNAEDSGYDASDWKALEMVADDLEGYVREHGIPDFDDARLSEPRYTVRQVAEAMVQDEFDGSDDPDGHKGQWFDCTFCTLPLSTFCTKENCIALLVPRLEALLREENKDVGSAL